MRWYRAYYFEVNVHQILIESLLCKDCSDMTSFLANSYSFHQIGWKLGGQLDYEVVQCLLFRGYSAPNFGRVLTISL